VSWTSRLASALLGAAAGRFLEFVHDGVLLCDPAGKVVAANRRAAEYLGLEPGQPPHRLSLALRRNPDLVSYLEGLRSGKSPETITVQTGYPRVRFLQVQGSLLHRLAVLTLTDVTRLHQLEQMRRRFTADLSHELRTPVTAIRLLTEALERDRPELAEHTQRILTATKRLEQLVAQILDLSRLEAGQEQLSPEWFDPADLVGEAVDRIAPQAAAKQLRLVRRLEGERPWWGDYEKLLRLLGIYLDNAVRFSPPATEIVIRVFNTQEANVLTVTDHGPGILAEELPYVFQRFYKGQRQTGTPGFGLGLAIAKHIALAHGGEVFADSRVGEGSTFGVRLPTPAAPSGGR